MTRREIGKLLMAAAPVRSAERRRPNVLVFMTDQQSAMLPGEVRRPAFESLRRQGVEFTQAFCNTPQCSPARAALLTGLEPHHCGVVTNVDKTSLGKPLSPKLATVGSVFKGAGYRTGYFGKWHLGDEADESHSSSLQAFGFMESFHGTDKASAETAADWIRKQQQPWLAWVSVLNPHNIYQINSHGTAVAKRQGVSAPATTSSDLAEKPAAQSAYMNEDQGKPMLHYNAADWIRYRAFYCDLVEQADQCLQTVLNAVKREDTVIVFTSDHGDALGEHGLPFKGPFLYEPLIRIPLVIAGAGLARKARRDDFALSIDVAPTIASLAGVTWPGKVDGKDLSKGVSGRDAVFLEYYGKQHWVTPIRTIRTRRWKLNRYASGEVELYDLQNDLQEATNLAAKEDSAKVCEDLERRIAQWWGQRPVEKPVAGENNR